MMTGFRHYFLLDSSRSAATMGRRCSPTSCWRHQRSPAVCPISSRILARQHCQRTFRGQLRVQAFVETKERSTAVALDVYRVLRVNQVASKDTVSRAFGQLVNASPKPDFSQVLH